MTRPFAWDALARALERGEIAIEAPMQALGFVSTTTLEPEPVPLVVKIALLGSRRLYFLLNAFEPKFPQIFKMAADFEEEVRRDARRVRRAPRRRPRQALDRARGPARHPARGERPRPPRPSRRARLQERTLDAVVEGPLQIATSGAEVGQINGLAVVALDDASFGKPSRITARVRLGGGEFVDIEREVKLGGPLHSTGVLILGGCLGAQYATDLPLSLHASLVFEQS